ncbi:hypothetical protein EDB84DRAFT_1572066 [Lactarius hengduanensis]|nr:hypothetical protein EDB84DRAFT_1572066 [Lactarius hengduanensis]
MSINGQQGHAQSCRDDLESLVYTIIFSAHGDLPWTATSAYSNQKAVLQKKQSVTAEELHEGLPTPFCNFVTYVHSLGFDEKPDYQYLHSILSQCSAAEADHPGKALPSPTLSIVSPGREPVSSDQVGLSTAEPPVLFQLDYRVPSGMMRAATVFGRTSFMWAGVSWKLLSALHCQESAMLRSWVRLVVPVSPSLEPPSKHVKVENGEEPVRAVTVEGAEAVKVDGVEVVEVEGPAALGNLESEMVDA